jgi:hypothetical protein
VAETCEVVWWHGARKGGFEARLDGRGGRPLVVARSRPITWSGDEPPPPEGRAADAHRMLVEKLLGQGWEPASQGDDWYSSRFQRGPTR